MVPESLKEYLEVTPGDEAHMRELLPAVRPLVARCSQLFRDRLLAQDRARAALEAARQIPRLDRTFSDWLEQLFSGPLDGAYYERRCRMGRFRARIGVAEHCVVTAMSGVRVELEALAQTQGGESHRESVDRMLDFDLAIMAQAHRDAELELQAQHERSATQGQLIATMGHELRSPLSVMESSLFILQRRGTEDPGEQKHLDRISSQIQLTSRKVVGLLELVRDLPLTRLRIRVSEVVETAVRHASVPDRVRLKREGLDQTPEVFGDPERLSTLFQHLLENALQAIGEGPGEIVLAAQGGRDREVVLSLTDSGPGVDPWVLPRLFEPLTTTRRDQLGLGLALVRRIAEAHTGSVRYLPGPPHRFVVTLPRA